MKIGARCIDNDENIWDDTLLIKAYEQSIKLQQAEMAKRLARATNKKSSDNSDSTNEDDDVDGDAQTSVEDFQVGDFVRATYDADGIDYEAEIMAIDENSDCRIKFIGYENEQIVAIADLLPSWGPEERVKQTNEAADAAAAEEAEYTVANGVEPTVQQFNVFNTHQFGSLLQPPPPPPMPPMLSEMTEDSEHLSAMLMAWYMSGYYTGLYQGHKMSKQKVEQPSQRRAPSQPKKKKWIVPFDVQLGAESKHSIKKI